VGNALWMTNTGGLGDVTARTYDALDRLTAETIDFGLFTKTVSYSYDGVGNILTLTDPDGQTIAYAYDAAGRLIEATDPAGMMTTIVYDPAGRELETHFPHGVWTANSYDDAGRLTNVTTRDAADGILFEYDYTYDPAGQVLSVVQNKVITEAAYQYNPAGWLTDADYYAPTVQNLHYTYDLVGNRMIQEDDGNVTSYLYDAEYRVLTQVFPDLSAIDYFHDNNANVIQTSSGWGVVDYGYDYENRLTVITYPVPFGAIATYYSPESERLARNERGQWTYYYPTLLGVVVEMNALGQTTARLNPGISLDSGGPLATYVHWDGRDNTTHFTDGGGGQVASLGFGFFGEGLYGSGDIDGVDPGLYASNMKMDWDPMLGAELIGGDYAPDINQQYGSSFCGYDPLCWRKPSCCCWKPAWRWKPHWWRKLYCWRTARWWLRRGCCCWWRPRWPWIKPRWWWWRRGWPWKPCCCAWRPAKRPFPWPVPRPGPRPAPPPAPAPTPPVWAPGAPPTPYRRTGTGMAPGPIGPLNCGRISFNVYQGVGQFLIDIVGAAGAVPVRPGPPPYTQVRADIAYTGNIWIMNTNQAGAFQRRGTSLRQFKLPFFVDVWYRDVVTLALGGPCRIQ
jgi:YD repeat-containing protein